MASIGQTEGSWSRSFAAAGSRALPSGDRRLLEYSQGFCVKHSVRIYHRTGDEKPQMNALPIALLRGRWRSWAAAISASMRAGVGTCRGGSIRCGGRSIAATGFAGRTPRFTASDSSSTAKIACGCAITSGRTQFAADVSQYSLEQRVPTVLPLRP